MKHARVAIAGLAGAILACVVAALVPSEVQSQGPASKAKKIDLSKPFDHGSHFKELRQEGDRLLTCADCHTLSATTAKEKYPICKSPRMPFPSHDACTGCHPTAFFTRPLQICSNCHTDNTFQAQPPLKEQTTANAPLRPMFSHKLHLDPRQRVKKRFKFERDCTFCHTFARGGEKVLKPAHAQCCECHTKEHVEPNINTCAGCHARPRSQVASSSMIEKFSHANHTTDPRTGLTLECQRCHSNVPATTKVRQITKPVMATCVQCHQGEVAFNYTNCLKCHGDEISKKPVPASHK